ncbi:MAG: hypothetical protein PHI49_12045 [Halothiobacillaceae bacterium]|nr:hypothetical protein [Halothiobacillaceae bacterium]
MKVTLIQAHTHKGRDHPAGATLDVDEGAADWLLAHDIACQSEPAPPPAAAAAEQKPAPRNKRKEITT